ncbi:multidrug ABC transporter ATP-binding protein [Clostridium sp. W14A]|nr:multidrug ABC transporter ATP-binding protein [Clostridium sp. W14A]
MFKTVRRIMKWASEYKTRLYLGFVCSFLAAGFTAGPVILAAWALDLVIKDSYGQETIKTNLVWTCLLAVLILVFLRFLFSYWKNKLQESIGYEVAAKQRIHIGDILKRVSLGYFAEHHSGDILAAVTTELSTLELQGMKMIDTVVNGYIQAVVIVCCIAIYSPPAALICAVGILLSAFALHHVSQESFRTATVTHQAQENLSGASIEYVRGLPIVKSFGQQGASAERFHRACKDNKKLRIQSEFGFVPWTCLHLFLLKIAAVALVLVTAWQTLNGTLSLSEFIMIAMFSFTIFGSVEPMNEAAHILPVINSAMDKLSDLEKAGFIDSDGQDIILKDYNVDYLHVSFGYGEREILHDISFTIPQNTVTAIVGPSGSGKSTICSLLTRFYDPQKGAISIGGVDIRQMTCDSLLKNISMVFQNVYLFHDTIRNNIKFGKQGATETEIIAASKSARCHDFISSLPDGYDTVIGEGGGTLSGGEKQRISIARAMLKNAPIIILDEATASVDPENEHEIQAAISSLTHGKTIITIAHRLATIENADQILVVDNGQIVQKGTHKELINQDGVYQMFVSIRQASEGWRFT